MRFVLSTVVIILVFDVDLADAMSQSSAELTPAPVSPALAANSGEETAPNNSSTATLLAVGATAASVVGIGAGFVINEAKLGLILLGGAGLVVGPSAGHIYTRNWGRGALGLGIRAVGMGLFLHGATLDLDGTCDSDRCKSAGSYMTAGLVIVAGGAIYNLIDAPLSAHREDKRLSSTIVVSPTLLRGPRGRQLLGGQLSMIF